VSKGAFLQIPRTSVKDYLLLAGFTLAAIAVQGYHPAVEDAEIYAPGILKALHPSLFPYNSQFFQSHASMTIFPNLIAGSIRLTHLPLWWAFFAWQIVTSFLLLWACLRIARLCFAENFAAWCGVALTASLFALPVAGTALLIVDPYLTTRSFSTPGALLAIACVLERRYFSAIFLILFTAAIHPLMAVYAATFLAVLITLKLFPSPIRLPEWIPNLSRGLFPPVTSQYHAILQTRPYFFLSNWAWYEWLGLLAPFAVLTAFAQLARRHCLGSMGLLCQSLAIYGVLFTAVAALIARQENLAEIQPLRFLHLLYVMMFLFAGGLIGKFLLKKSAWCWALLFVPLCAGMAYAQDRLTPSSPHFELPGRHSRNTWVQAFKWVRRNTPESAYFALDPRYMALPGEDQHGFRAIAQRSALADAVKDSGAASMFPALASPWTDQLNAQKGWETFHRDDFLRLKKNYGVDWIVIQSPGVPGLPCPYATSQLLVCRIE
jgi:hypothetical protein